MGIWITALRLAAGSLWAYKARSLLTMLGIIIGIGSVIVMISVGRGAKEHIQAQISSLGDNMLMIFSGSSRQGGVRSGFGTKPTLRVKDAEANAETDAKFEELVASRNTCDGLVHAARNTIEEAGEHATDEEKAAIEAAITEAEEALKADDKESIDAAATKLTEATGPVAQKMYAAQAEAAQGEAAGAGEQQAEPA